MKIKQKDILLCDVCMLEVEKIEEIKYPVMFYTNQDDGSATEPYISYEKLDMCDECIEKAIRIQGAGVQGNNNYTIK